MTGRHPSHLVRAALVVAVLSLLAALPPVGAQSSWSVDGLLVVDSAEKATLVVTISGLTNTRLTYSIPEGATFLEARDTADDPVTATVSGDDVEVQIRSRPVRLRYDLAPEDEAPLTHYSIAPLGAGTSSPTTMRIQLGTGWTYLGAADRTAPSPVLPTASGTFSRTGGGFFDYIVARPGLEVPPADPTVGGSIVKRLANASVTTAGTHVRLEQIYDTDVYSRDWQMPLPENATNIEVYSPMGAIEPTIDAGGMRIRAPYPTGYHLGARGFTIEYDLPPPEAHGGSFQRANISIRAQDDDEVWLNVTYAPGLIPTGALTAGAEEPAPGLYHARGPLFVGAAFLPPATAARARFTEGFFVVDAPASMEAAARATARNASELLPGAASFAITGPIERPFFVTFTEADIFPWEAGFYSNGLNTISIRASALQNASDGKAHLEPVGILVHEATHGLIDRLMPEGPRGVALLHEGLARLAETRVEAAFADQIFQCTQTARGQSCERESARPDAQEVRDYLRSGVTFPEGWTTSTASENERGFLYDYSGLVMHQYALRSPQGALASAVVNVSRQAWEDDEPDTPARIIDTLLAHAPGTSRDALLYPGKAAAQLTLEQFRYCMYGLVAPGYPWEGDGTAPADGCPESGYGPSDAPLPALPPERETGLEPAPLPPTPSPLPAEPTTSAPSSGEELPTSGDGLVDGVGEDGEAPGALARPAVPGSGVAALVAAALVALALLKRRS